MKVKIASMLLLSLLAAPAIAESSNAYLMLDAGTASYQNMAPFNNPGKIGLGFGYRYSQNIATEVSYTNFGESKITYVNTGNSATLKASSFQFSVVGSQAINDQFAAFGKIGLASNKADVTTNVVGVSASTSQSSLYFGGGLQYNVNQRYSLKLQYENFGNFDSTSSPMSASAVSIGLLFNL